MDGDGHQVDKIRSQKQKKQKRQLIELFLILILSKTNFEKKHYWKKMLGQVSGPHRHKKIILCKKKKQQKLEVSTFFFYSS